MGSPENEFGRRPDEVRHRVELTKGFWLAKTEFTLGDWQALGGKLHSSQTDDAPEQPVCHAGWESVAGGGGFLEKINTSSPDGWRSALPTEAHWE